MFNSMFTRLESVQQQAQIQANAMQAQQQHLSREYLRSNMLASLDGPGRWVPHKEMHAASNIYMRPYRNSRDGTVTVYPGAGMFDGFPPDENSEWWFPMDVDKAPRVDGATNVPVVRRLTPPQN